MSAADALPPLSRAELHALAAELRRTIDAGGYEGAPVAQVFIALLERCSECASAWPVWPDKDGTP